MKIVVAVTLYNSQDIIIKTLTTIMEQTYSNFVCYITDDLSTDNSANIAEEFIKNDNRFKVIRNTEKRYQAGNYDLICRDTLGIDDEDILIEVDGDDWLAHNSVFADMMETYTNNPNIWITNGCFKYSDGRAGFSSPVTNLDTLRYGHYTASHLRTWKIFLWRAMKPDDLRDSNNNWWTAACDLIFMYDMLELAGLEHYKFVDKIHYIYNDYNDLNEHKVYRPKIDVMINFTRNKKPKDRLIRL